MATIKRLPGYKDKPDFEQPSWSQFKACPLCTAEEGKACRRYLWGTYKSNGHIKSRIMLGRILRNPHKGRKKILARPLGYRITW